MMTIDEARQLAEAAQQNALNAQGRMDEYQALHLEVTLWRQGWEKDMLNRREAEGAAAYGDKALSMLSEMAYKEHDPETWERYLKLSYAVQAAEHGASTAAAAAQVTALVENMEARERMNKLEEGWRNRQLDEGENEGDESP